jgi:uncharacterized protein (TIGR04255 family)
MASSLPIPPLDRVPTRITPCPILEAILEVRFVTSTPWSVLPGLLFQQIRDKYCEPEDLALAKVPEEIRRTDSNLSCLPLVSFKGSPFSIRLGPRVITLHSLGEYPGWTEIQTEMEWLMERIRTAGFFGEGERLGMRYIDFFEGDLFPNFRIRPVCADSGVDGVETAMTFAFEREDFQVRLILNNSVTAEIGGEPRSGSVFDLDLSLNADQFDLFENGMERFAKAHRINKEIFFGLLEPEFLSTLEPEYV